MDNTFNALVAGFLLGLFTISLVALSFARTEILTLRSEAQGKDEPSVFVPNHNLTWLPREVSTRYDSMKYHHIGPEMVIRETEAFRLYVKDLTGGLDEANAWYRISWGGSAMFSVKQKRQINERTSE